jgi:hypothetical protein
MTIVNSCPSDEGSEVIAMNFSYSTARPNQ